MPTVQLQSSDRQTFEISGDFKISMTLQGLMEDLGFDKEGGTEVLPLANVKTSSLVKVIAWATKHRSDPPPTHDENCLPHARHGWDGLQRRLSLGPVVHGSGPGDALPDPHGRHPMN